MRKITIEFFINNFNIKFKKYSKKNLSYPSLEFGIRYFVLTTLTIANREKVKVNLTDYFEILPLRSCKIMLIYLFSRKLMMIKMCVIHEILISSAESFKFWSIWLLDFKKMELNKSGEEGGILLILLSGFPFYRFLIPVDFVNIIRWSALSISLSLSAGRLHNNSGLL